MQEKITFKDRLRYQMDNLYSRGTIATVVTLGFLTLILAVTGALILYYSRLAPGDEESYSLLEAFWVGLQTAIGNGSTGGRESVWSYRLLMLVLTFGAIFIGSFFISALTNGLVSRVSELKKGRSKIIEDGHTVILGWSDQVFTTLSELMVANQSQPQACIAILGQAPKDVMEGQIHERVKTLGKTRIVCRTGDPMEMTDLNIVSLNTSKNIIILPPKSEYPDADVIKTVLAITNHPRRRDNPYQIVSSIRNPRNFDIAMVAGKQEVVWLISTEIVARVIAQTSLQPGLSVVYNDLFDFNDQEIYFKDEPSACGRSFDQALLSAERNAVIGIYTNQQQVLLNPPRDRVIQHGEQLIVIAPDDSAVQLDLQIPAKIQTEKISLGVSEAPTPKQILVLGWNWRGTRIIQELDGYVAPGSEVTVLADHEKVEDHIERECRALDNLKVCFFPGDTDDRQILEGILFKTYDNIIILGYSDKLSTQRADAKTLVTLLHLRDIKERDQLNFTVVTEMMDIRNYQLASTARADDYVVSERLISLMLAQIAENKHLNEVFTELLNPESVEIYLKPANLFVKVGEPVDFFTIVEAACQRSEVAFGYRIAALAGDPTKNYGVTINPVKSALVTFAEDDKIVVLASQGR